MKTFPNPTNNNYINDYNKLIQTNGICENNRNGISHKKLKEMSYSLHHIIPRSFDPSLTNDKDNQVWLPIKDHIHVHYLLWKGLNDPKSAMAFWFIYIYGKNNLDYIISDNDDKLLHENVNTYLKSKRHK